MRDAIVIGGGPAGSTAAHLLAKEGHDVLLVDKERFPRFHIGESLLPMDLPIFERLGVEPEEGVFLRKQGADFIDERTGQSCRYFFRDGLPGCPEYAYQVDRASFDLQLLELAREAGSSIREGERVLDVAWDEEGVNVRTEREVHRARFVIDATGQSALLGRARRSLEPVKGFGLAAAFCHFEGLGDSAISELEATGNITILMRDDGWAWVIPLTRGRLSVGAVSNRQGVGAATLDQTIEESAMLARLVRGADRKETRLIGNFSYLNRQSHGARYGCAGDAAGFLDPVFSSGVTLALVSAEAMVDILSPALKERREADPDLLAPLASRMGHAYEVFGSLIQSFYHTGLVRNLFFHDSPDSEIRAGLISILAGDIERDDNLYQQMLLRSRRRRSDLRGPVD